MQIEHIDMIGAHQAERILQTRNHLLRRPPFLAAKLGLGRDHHGIPWDGFQRPADHAFGAVGRRGVDEIDAEPNGFVDQPRGLVLGFPGLQAEPGKPAGAEAGDADAEVGFAEGGVDHDDQPDVIGKLPVNFSMSVITVSVQLEIRRDTKLRSNPVCEPSSGRMMIRPIRIAMP